jgi:2-polyprenyl-6-methoxyphenol hydroxylase-like FAD-dependent oxidoreductase
MMLGFLLARAGLDVTVLEKHGDFLRDFRGDTIHPSTLTVMHELGLLDEFRPLLQNEITTLDVVLGERRITPVDFSTLPPPVRFLGLMPQWDFLDFLAGKAAAHPGFRLLMRTEATGLLDEDGRVTGVAARGPEGPLQVDCDLVVAADGRDSVVRREAALPVRDTGVPIDVLWFRLEKPDPEPPPTLAYVAHGDFVLTIDRGDYYQGGMLIPKGSLGHVRAEGLGRLRDRLVTAAPVLAGCVDGLRDWEQVKLLAVQVNHLPTWHRPGLLCIGDAAHAMSPAFGVGVNYAVQDAIAAARTLAGPLRAGVPAREHLAAVQRRRAWATRAVQRIQVLAHRAVARPGGRTVPDPLLRLEQLTEPALQRLTARLVGLGFRPEHVAG